MSKDRPLALVTGGVRRLGSVIASALAAKGYDLALSTHSSDADDADFAQKLTAEGRVFHIFEADLADGEQATGLVDVVAEHFGRLPNLLVNNAAIFGQDDSASLTEATLHAHFALNAAAPILLANRLAQLHAERSAAGQSKACVIHILDQRITNPHGDQLSYSLSKQALAGSVRVLASALRGQLRVNGVAPGLVIETSDYARGQLERLGSMMPLGNLPSPQAVADAVLYLAGAEHVTGQIIFADGGAHLAAFPRDFMHL